jgi:hypothetical protein
MLVIPTFFVFPLREMSHIKQKETGFAIKYISPEQWLC